MDTQVDVGDNARPATTPENIFLLIPNIVGEFYIQHEGELWMLTC